MKRLPLNAAVTAALLLSVVSATNAQTNTELDIGRFVIAGYGDVSYVDIDNVNTNVVSRFVPIFLFQLSEKIHIEAELELSIDENGETELELEYADLHYFLNDNTTLTAGKFLLPFGQFGPNYHPSWINKLPSAPGIYGHHSNSLLKPLLPILSDAGINVGNSFNLGNGKLFTDFYVVSGPRIEADDHGEEEEHDDSVVDEEEHEFPEVEFEYAQGDNNNEIAFGGRIAYAFLPQWEVGYSFYQGAYDDDGALDFKASAIDFSWIGTYASVRGEIINTTTEGFDEHDEEVIIKDFDRDGWYIQGSWQMRQLGQNVLNPVELVARYSKISKFNAGERWTFGVNYWLESSAVLKFAYDDTELENDENDNRIFVQLAFGF